MSKRKHGSAGLSLRQLRKEERWDCHGCTRCCRGTIVSLDASDLALLESQEWDKHPDMSGTPIARKSSWFGNRYELARRDNGDCVFLTSEGRCRIHEQFGEEAKPWICQVFPLQTVRLDRNAWLTIRRSCPSAAVGRGRPLKEHLGDLRRRMDRRGVVLRPATPPPITRGYRAGWDEVHRVADSLKRLVFDKRYPPARRLFHGVQFCRFLDECRWKWVEARRMSSLLAMFEVSAEEDTNSVFFDRMAPTRSARSIFHQAVFEHLRLHPRYVIRPSWGEKWRLARAGFRFASGRGELPMVHPGFPSTTFESFDRPLGHLDNQLLLPINDYFESVVLSREFMMLGRVGWPITESFRALALSYAIIMWLVRLTSTGREPTVEDVVDAIGTVDRAQGFAALCGRRHRHRVAGLEYRERLDVVIAWYAR